MNGLTVPFFALDRQYASLKDEIDHITQEVMASGQYLKGELVNKFEFAMAERLGRKYSICVNSATNGLAISLLACNAKKVGVPNYSFSATANVIPLANASAIPIDVDRQGIIDIDEIDLSQHVIDSLMYVNMYGNTIDYNKLLLKTGFFHVKSKVNIIEDAAQSLGATYQGKPSGSLGDISVLSFDPTKNLPNYGSGGMVLTDSTHLYNRIYGIANNHKGHLHTPGRDSAMNSQMSEVDCAGMLVKLDHFDKWQARRKQIAEYYLNNITEVELPVVNEGVEHAWHKFVIHTVSRNQLGLELRDNGVETRIHYPNVLFHSDLSLAGGAAALSATTLSLPIYPEMTDNEVEYVAAQVTLGADRIWRRRVHQATATRRTATGL